MKPYLTHMSTISIKRRIGNVQYMRQMMVIVDITIICYIEDCIQKIEFEE